MTWHLKDRELEKKLLEIDPDFSEKLNQNCEKWDSNGDGDLFEFKHFTQSLTYKSKLLGDLIFSGNELTNIEYNPKSWNEFPMVTPPDRKMMQIEYDRDFGCGAMKVRVIGIYSEFRKCWFMFDPNSDEGFSHLGCPICRIGIYENLRFRQLED